MHFKIQTHSFIDQITEDGIELTRRPYPFFTDERGMILNSKSHAGRPARVVGFAIDLRASRIDMHWVEAVYAPVMVIGLYVITMEEGGKLATHLTAVETFEIA